MTNQPKTGSVTSNSGKVVVGGNVVIGIKIEGVVSDEVCKAALETIRQMNTGHVSGALGVEISGDAIIGVHFRHFDPETPTPEGFIAELKALRQALAGLAAEPDVPAKVGAAVKSLDDTIAETEETEPMAERLSNRLGEAIKFMTDAGKALEAASKAGPLIARAIATATLLYQAVGALF